MSCLTVRHIRCEATVRLVERPGTRQRLFGILIADFDSVKSGFDMTANSIPAFTISKAH